jgi:plasmid stabilization system protein ParE
LFDIVDLVAEYAGSKVAARKLAEIEQALKLLADTPHIGSVRDELYPGLRAIPVARKGVITFTVDDAERAIYVVSIAYAGADWVGRLPARTVE